MNWKLSAPALMGAVFIAAGASAATPTTAVPTLSGGYVYAHTTFCQPTILVNYGNTGPSLINLNGAGSTGGWGDVQVDGGTVGFNSTKLTVSYSGTDVEGTPMMLQSSGGGPDNLEGTAFAQSASTGNTTFSNTATTVTLNGQLFNAYYGVVTSGGIAEYVVLVGKDSKGCAQQWTFSRK